MGEVVVRLGQEARDHLREIMARSVNPAGKLSALPCPLCQEIEAALDSPPVEEQIDHRVVVGQGEDMEQRGLFIGCWESEARSAAARQRRRGFTDARVQARTVVHSPWTDLPSEEGER